MTGFAAPWMQTFMFLSLQLFIILSGLCHWPHLHRFPECNVYTEQHISQEAKPLGEKHNEVLTSRIEGKPHASIMPAHEHTHTLIHVWVQVSPLRNDTVWIHAALSPLVVRFKGQDDDPRCDYHLLPPRPEQCSEGPPAPLSPFFNKSPQAHPSSQRACQSVLGDLSGWKMNQVSQEKAPSETPGHEGSWRHAGCGRHRAAAQLSTPLHPLNTTLY